MLSKITKPLLQSLMFLAACGFLLSLVLHLLAWAGLQPSGNALFLGLMFGLVPVAIPGIFIAMRLTQGLKWRQHWRATVAGCPTWMRRVQFALSVYFIVTFVSVLALPFVAAFVFPSLIPFVDSAAKSNFDNPPRLAWIFFTTFFMGAYFSQITLAMTASRRGLQQRCSNGHAVAITDKFCRTCGVPIPPPGGGEVRGAA